MSEYTPMTEQVREAFARHATRPVPAALTGLVYPTTREGRAWFDRWKDEFAREVAEKAWDEGARHVYTEGGKCSFARDGDPCPYNPYREGQGDV